MKNYTKEDVQSWLRDILKPGDTVYTVCISRNRLGTSRKIKLVCLDRYEEKTFIRDITLLAAKAIGARVAKDENGIIVGGCGMDMGFHLVYSLSAALWPNVPCTGEGCNSNDHANGDRDYSVGHIHRDGGYALNHKWL